MMFQFLCPQGHLLEGEESQAGRRFKCPHCATEFVIPQPASLPGVDTGEVSTGGTAPTEEAPQFDLTGTGQQSIVHISCPNGHVLGTPREMLGQDAMCPFCKVQFRLRLEDSREYRRQQAEERARREQKIAKAWMQWSIVAAVVVVLGVILLLAVAFSG